LRKDSQSLFSLWGDACRWQAFIADRIEDETFCSQPHTPSAADVFTWTNLLISRTANNDADVISGS
jgi:hypothetical protein